MSIKRPLKRHRKKHNIGGYSVKLIVIDIQKGITDERLYDFDGFIKNVTSIIDAARKNNVEIIYVQHDDGPGTGFSFGDKDFEIADQVAPKENEKIFIKTINSCFGNNDLANYLRESKEKDLMIVGLQTNFCVDASVKSAFERGYKVIVPKGTNSTFDNDYMDRETTYKYYNDMMWPERFASCISVDDAIKMIEDLR
jgi:nicotinamidase-related amidase